MAFRSSKGRDKQGKITLILPSGEHEIEFRFEPKSFSISENISRVTSIILLLALLAVAGFEVYRRKRTAS